MNETYQEKLERMKRDLKRATEQKRIQFWRSVITSCLVMIICGNILATVLLLPTRYSYNYIDKCEVQNTLSRIVHNGGGIEEVKQAFGSVNRKTKPLFTSEMDFLKSNYTAETPLSSVLSDLLVSYYTQDSILDDTTYVLQLRKIIASYSAVHPFDKLEEGQRYYLENIHQKLDSNFSIVQEDLIKLGDELDRKNLLVNEYLRKSDISFYISIVALLFSIIIAGWQIKLNYDTTKQLDLLIKKENSDSTNQNT